MAVEHACRQLVTNLAPATGEVEGEDTAEGFWKAVIAKVHPEVGKLPEQSLFSNRRRMCVCGGGGPQAGTPKSLPR